MDRYREDLVKDKNQKTKWFKGLAITSVISFALAASSMLFPPAFAATAIAKVIVDLTASVAGLGLAYTTFSGIAAAKASRELKVYDKERAELEAKSNYQQAEYERESVKDMEVSMEPTKEEEEALEMAGRQTEPVKESEPELAKPEATKAESVKTQDDGGRIL